jgi:hypothetical protein
LNGLGLWVIDAPPQSPPLFTDDPGVPDKGEYELNFTTRGDRAPSTRNIELFSIDANYGVLPKISGHELPLQLKFEAPISAARVVGQPYGAGIGPVGVGVKLNFYSSDKHGVEMSVYPQIEFAPGSGAVDKGLAEDGQTLVFPVLFAKEFRYVTLVVNAGVEKPIHSADREVAGTAGISIGVPITRKWALMGELHGERPFHAADDRELIVNAGIMRAVGHIAVIYGNVGRTIVSEDGEAHTFLGIGLKVLVKPDKGDTKKKRP